MTEEPRTYRYIWNLGRLPFIWCSLICESCLKHWLFNFNVIWTYFKQAQYKWHSLKLSLLLGLACLRAFLITYRHYMNVVENCLLFFHWPRSIYLNKSTRMFCDFLSKKQLQQAESRKKILCWPWHCFHPR